MLQIARIRIFRVRFRHCLPLQTPSFFPHFSFAQFAAIFFYIFAGFNQYYLVPRAIDSSQESELVTTI